MSAPDDADPSRRIRHDLRTPLNQIIGYSEMLEEQAADAGQATFVPDLRRIQAAARGMLSMVEQYFASGAPPPARRMATFELDRVLGGPRAGRDDDAGAPAEEERPDAPLLVVDDSEMNRDMLARRLAARGFAVETASDGEEALARIRDGRYALVLLDVMMPGISGLDVLRQVRARAAVADLPVIMATSLDDSRGIVEALRLGANDYVTKPLDFPVVLGRVRTQLALRRARETLKQLAEELERRNAFIRKTFGRYLSDEVVDSLLDSPDGLRLGGEKRDVTLLMCDLRGFTALAERLAPDQVIRLINHFLGTMADVITAHQGTIDEFIGDAALVIFGAPVSRPDDAARAVRCAVAMQRAMESVNAFNRAEGLPEVEMGVAVHSGEVVVGNIGSQTRAKYGVVGSTVNLAARIESHTVGGQVLISAQTRARVGDLAAVGDSFEVRAKGVAEPCVVYDLLGTVGPSGLALPDRREPLRALSSPIAAFYRLVDEKNVAETESPASLVAVSSRGAELHVTEPLAHLQNLRLRLGDGAPAGDLYAKVVDSGGGTAMLRFTSVPPAVAEHLASLR